MGIVRQAQTALEALRRAHHGRVEPQLAEQIRVAGGFNQPLVAKARDAAPEQLAHYQEPEETEPEEEQEPPEYYKEEEAEDDEPSSFHEQALLHHPARDQEKPSYDPEGGQEELYGSEVGVARPKGEVEEGYFGKGSPESPPNLPSQDLEKARVENRLTHTPRINIAGCSGVEEVVKFHNETFKTEDTGEYGRSMRRFHRGGGK